MFGMKDVCNQVGISYETLRYYCNEGLIPNVKRDQNQYRQFDERDVAWLHSLLCLKKCGLGIREMKQYLNLCLKGPTSIPERKKMLSCRKLALLEKQKELEACLCFIDEKQAFYDGVLNGTIAYTSNLICFDSIEEKLSK